jgi:protein-disulfide isomerase
VTTPKEGDIVRKVISRGAGAALAVLLAAAPASVLAQESKDDLKKEIDGLKQGQQEILKQLDEIKKMMATRQAPAAPAGPNVKDVIFNLGANPTKGPATAKLTLVEFTDYQ